MIVEGVSVAIERRNNILFNLAYILVSDELIGQIYKFGDSFQVDCNFPMEADKFGTEQEAIEELIKSWRRSTKSRSPLSVCQ